MKSTKSLLPKILIMTLVATLGFTFLCIYAGQKAYAEDPELTSKIEAALEKHYDTKNIRLRLDVGNEQYNFLQAFAMPINKIAINTTSGSVDFVTVKNTNQVTIKNTKSNNKFKLTDDKTLSLEENKSFGSANVIVELPENFNGTISIKSVSGDITVSDITTNQLNVVSVSGDSKLNQIAAKKSILYSVSGDIKLSQKTAGEMTVNSISGKIDLSLLNSNEGLNFNLKSLSGHINNAFKDAPVGKTQVFVTTTSGDISIH